MSREPVPAEHTSAPGLVLGSGFVSAAALRDRATRVAAGLRELGVGPGAPVAVLARNDSIHLEVALAAAQLGSSVLPVNWRWTGEEIRFILLDSESAAVVGHADLLAPVVDAIPPDVATVWAATPPLVSDAYQIDADHCSIPAAQRCYQDWLDGPDTHRVDRPEASSSGLFYTSGTTGRPKGVLRSAPTPAQVAQRHKVLTTCYGIVPGARMLITTPLLEVLAGLAADAQRFQKAVRLLGAASVMRDAIGYRLCLTERDADLAASRVALGPAFQTAYDEGRSLTPEQAAAFARRRRGERKRPVSGWDSLTPAETQVVALISEGLSNPGIARRLMCSPRTVQAHLTHIYAKVGVKSRAELAARAVRHEQL